MASKKIHYPTVPPSSRPPPKSYPDSGFLVHHDETSNSTATPRQDSPASMKRGLFSDMRNVYHSYAANTVIGVNAFSPKLGDEIRNAVLHSPAVKEAIQIAVQSKPNLTVGQVKAEVIKLLSEMNAEPKERVARGMTYTVQKILKRLYKHVAVIHSQIEMIKKVAKQAAGQGIPLIITPCHKSHIDYMVISWLFFQIGVSMPFVAAGENLDMPLVGSLLQASGAFFIRRQFGTDALYRVVFNEYITQLLVKGLNLEFFIEGGRSRTGKLLNPKMGLLNVVCDAFFSGKLKDAMILPVSIGYDKVIETEGYIQEMLGRAKPPESLLQLLRAIELLKLNFGTIDLRFAEPFSLKALVESEGISRGLNYYGGAEESKLKARRQFVNVLAYKTLYMINMTSAALPTALVVTVLLTQEGRGVSKSLLTRKVSWLRQEIAKRGGHVCHLSGNPASVVDQVAVLLGSSIGRHTQLLETVYTPQKRFELSYYRNSLIHFFVSESIVACCMYSFKVNRSRNERIPKSELMHAAQYLSRLLKHEFIYKPLPDFADKFEETLSWMVGENILELHDTPTPQSSHAAASSSSEHSSSDVTVVTGPYVSVPEDQPMFKFLCFLIWPFVECYWMVAASFVGLFPNHVIEESEFIKSIQRFGETLYYEGELNFYESISKEITKLALTRFYERNVIVKRVINEKGNAVINLGEAYAKDEAKLLRFAAKIAQYRRKGKYRTSAGTVDHKAIAHLITTTPKARAKL